MATKTNNDNPGYIKKETTLLIALLTLAIGFFGGVMFGVYRSGPAPVAQGPAMPPQPAQTSQIDSETGSRIATLEKEAAANPTDAGLWTQLGNLFFDTNQFEKAIEAYNKALELDPKNANVWTDLGVMYRRSGNPKKAIEAFDAAIAADPKHEVSRFNKGVVQLHDLKDTAGAIGTWEGLVAVNPLAMSPTGTSVDQMVQQMKSQMSPSAEKPRQ